MTLVAGIDLGTHGARVLITDAMGNVHAEAAHPYWREIRPGGVQEQALEPVWAALTCATQKAMAEVRRSANVVGIALTHQRGTLVALDDENQPIGSAICDSDIRSQPQADRLRQMIGQERLYETTGCPPVPFNGLTKILWWLDERPEQESAVSTWASLQDWAVCRLTGRRVSSSGAALRLGVLDIISRTQYATDLLVALDLAQEKFAPLQSFGTPLGYIESRAARELGLSAGTPVFAAPGDQPSAVLGTGAVVQSAACINLGTSFLTSIPVDHMVSRGAKVGATLEVVDEQFYAVEIGSGAGTNVLDWLREVLLMESSVENLNKLAEASEAGANGLRVVPHWWSALSKSEGCIRGLRSSHTRADIVRATYEGLAYELRWAWDTLAGTVDRTPKHAVVFGGASRSDFLCQLLADVLNFQVYRCSTAQASSLGAAISAAIGVGWFDNAVEAAEAMASTSVHFEATPRVSQYYTNAYEEYMQLREALIKET